MSFPEPFYRWRPHPWHGLAVGDDPPDVVNAFIEITPFDLVKYEVDKGTGYLRVDRPQQTSSQPPALYGFIPQTYCGTRVRDLMVGAVRGDGDPLDVCVISERQITRSEIIVPARVVGGLPMIDGGEADDKIIAVLVNDPAWSHVQDLADLPAVMVERLRHYFLTYKLVPGQSSDVSIDGVYGRAHAHTVINAAVADYEERYGGDR
jgi:inorganic pyrophosphatase